MNTPSSLFDLSISNEALLLLEKVKNHIRDNVEPVTEASSL